jgi:hypothetical protein
MRNLAAGRDLSSGMERRYPRLRAEALACTINHLNRGVVLDLCEGGMSIEAVLSVTVGETLHISLDLLELNTPIEATGEVAWADSGGRAGVRFRSLPEISHLQLIEWLFRNALAVWSRTMADADGRAQSGDPSGQARKELDAPLNLIAERSQLITRASGAAIALRTEGGMVCRAASGTTVPDLGVQLEMGSGISGECLRTGGIVRCDHTETDSRITFADCRRLGIRSFVVMPLCRRREVVGVFGVFSTRAYAFDSYDIGILQRMAGLIIAARSGQAEVGQKLAGRVTRPRATELPKRTAGPRLIGPHRLVAEPCATEQQETVAESCLIEQQEPCHEPNENAPEISGNREPMRALSSPLLRAAAVVLTVLVVSGLVWRGTIGVARLQKRSSGEKTQPLPGQKRKSAQASVPALASSGAKLPGWEGKQKSIAHVTGILHSFTTDHARVVIELNHAVEYESQRLEDPDRIFLDLHNTRLIPALAGTKYVGSALLRRIRAVENRPGLARIVLDLNGFADYSVAPASDPYRLIIDVQSRPASTSSPVKNRR